MQKTDFQSTVESSNDLDKYCDALLEQMIQIMNKNRDTMFQNDTENDSKKLANEQLIKDITESIDDLKTATEESFQNQLKKYQEQVAHLTDEN